MARAKRINSIFTVVDLVNGVSMYWGKSCIIASFPLTPPRTMAQRLLQDRRGRLNGMLTGKTGTMPLCLLRNCCPCQPVIFQVHQAMKVMSDTQQTPLSANFLKTPYQELANPKRLLDYCERTLSHCRTT